MDSVTLMCSRKTAAPSTKKKTYEAIVIVGRTSNTTRRLRTKGNRGRRPKPSSAVNTQFPCRNSAALGKLIGATHRAKIHLTEHMIRLGQPAFVMVFLLASFLAPACDTSCAFENKSVTSTADGCCTPSAPNPAGHPANHNSGDPCGTKGNRSLSAVLVNAAAGVHFQQIPFLQIPAGGNSSASERAPFRETSQFGLALILPAFEMAPLPLRV